MNEQVGEWNNLFREAIQIGDLSKAIAIFKTQNKFSGTPRGEDKGKALTILLESTSHFQERYQLAEKLLKSESAAGRSLAVMLAETFIVQLFGQDPLIAKKFILRVADDSHWEIRESTDNLLIHIIKDDFASGYRLLTEWASHPSENVHRAVVMTLKKAGRERNPDWTDCLLDLLECFLSDRSVYVRKNLGPFAIGDGFLRYDSVKTLHRLEKWSKHANAQVRWNVAMAFSTAEAAKHIDSAIPILEQLASDNRRFVWRAVASAMRNLGKRNPKRILPVLTKWLGDPKRWRPAEIAMKYL